MSNVDMKAAKRQRRPAFDRERGIEVAQALFHARGYDALSVADLTEALDINPPSLYAAYGSKLALFERALRSYVETDFLPVDQLLSPTQEPARALAELFVAAARHYTRDSVRRGCMVTEAMRADDGQAAAIASALAKKSSALIRDYVAAHVPAQDVDRIVDYVLVTLRGLSSYACLGHSQDKLVECARIAGRALETEFSRESAAPAGAPIV